MQDVQVVLVNYKNEELTVKCLRALEKSSVRPQKVFIVDNKSCESSREYFQKQDFTLPVEFIWNANNVGFAAGCNAGIKVALRANFKGYIWLLNNDTEPETNALKNLLEKANSTGAAITGSLIVDSDGNYLGGVGIAHPFFASVHRPNGPECKQFSYIEGSSFLISQKCIDTIGLLSEDYFLYFEESDYCFRAKKAGLSLAWATNSVIKHHIGSSTGSENKKGHVPFFIDCLMIRNRIHFAMGNGFPFWGIAIGLLISLGLRVKRFQFNRVFTIIHILLSQKSFKKFIEDNGGFYELQHESK